MGKVTKVTIGLIIISTLTVLWKLALILVPTVLIIGFVIRAYNKHNKKDEGWKQWR